MPRSRTSGRRKSPPRHSLPGRKAMTGKRGITADTALRLAKCLNTSAEYWLTLQMQYDLAAVQKAIGERLEREVRPISLERQTDEEN